MRELCDWHGHGEHCHRHAHDAAVDASGKRARDTPKHGAHDGLKLKLLLDPEFRKAEHLRYRKAVEASEPKHAVGQLKPQEARPEQTPAETRDKLASKIAERQESLESQRRERRGPERSRPQANGTTAMA
jgi:hypothetical protein